MAATYNLGSAVATIVVTSDTKGVSAASDAVDDFGKKGDRSARIVDTALGNLAAIGIAKAIEGISNLAGTVWDLGMDRAIAIENAEAKMRGLGFAAEDVEGIMTNALAAVKGTQFGLGEAATLAATAVAAGIKPGAELERQLKLVTNAAAASGTGLDDMGSIMRKVWTSGKVGTEELNQLADRGIPIWSKLAETYGVSGEQLRDMVSNGQIDLETFTSTLESSVGTVADEMGGTFEGMSANAEAALGRLGEKAIGPLLPFLEQALTIITDLADEIGASFGPKISEIAGAIGSGLVSALTTAVQFMRDLANFIRDNITWIGPLVVAIGTFVAVFSTWVAVTKAIEAVKLAWAALNLVMAANPIGIVVSAIAALVAGLVWFFTQTDLGREIWANFTKFLGEAWNNVVAFVTDLIINLTTFFHDAFTNISDFITTTFTNISNFFTDIWNGILAVVQFVWNLIQTYIQTVVGIVIGIFTGDFSKVPGVVRGVWDKVMQFTQDVWNNILNWLGSVPGWILDVFAGAGKWLFGIGKDILNGLWNGLKSIWDGLVGWIGDIGSSIADTFAGVLGIHSPSRVFMGFGEDIIQGLMNGVESMRADAIGQIGGLSASLSSNVEHTINALPSAESADGSGPLTVAALFTEDNMLAFARVVASETASALLEIRTLDGRSAALVAKQGVR